MWNAKNRKLYRAGKWFPRAEVTETIGNDKWLDWAQALALKTHVYFERSYCNFIQHGWIAPQVGYIQRTSSQLQIFQCLFPAHLPSSTLSSVGVALSSCQALDIHVEFQGSGIHIPTSQVKAQWPPFQMSSTLACLVEWVIGRLGWKARR